MRKVYYSNEDFKFLLYFGGLEYLFDRNNKERIIWPNGDIIFWDTKRYSRVYRKPIVYYPNWWVLYKFKT
jgi:hypothetical protein